MAIMRPAGTEGFFERERKNTQYRGKVHQAHERQPKTTTEVLSQKSLRVVGLLISKMLVACGVLGLVYDGIFGIFEFRVIIGINGRRYRVEAIHERILMSSVMSGRR